MKNVNFELIKGDDKIWELNFSRDGVAQDITGWTIYFTMKKAVKDTTPILQKTITEHSNPTNGKSQIFLTNQETMVLENKYFYGIKTKNNQELITTVAVGQITIVVSI